MLGLWISLLLERIARAWGIMWQSFGILGSYKRLLLLPLVSAIFCVLASVVVIGGGALVFHLPLQNPTLHSEIPLVSVLFECPLGMRNANAPDNVSTNEEREESEHAWLCILLFYLANNFVITYFNVALASIALSRFRGEEATLDYGLTIAWNRKWNVLQWAFLASTIGVLIRLIRRQGRLGLWVSSLIGAAWALASFFAVPLLATENLSPGEVLQRSSSLIYKKWGEAVNAEFSFGLLFLVLALPGSLALSAAFYFGKFATLALPVVLAYWLVRAISTSAAKQVFVAALYRFAIADEVTTGFWRTDLTGAWRPAMEF